jgi:hypothetical protein
MRKARVTEDDILAMARELEGLERLDQIKFAVLERSGGITVVPKRRPGERAGAWSVGKRAGLLEHQVVIAPPRGEPGCRYAWRGARPHPGRDRLILARAGGMSPRAATKCVTKL